MELADVDRPVCLRDRLLRLAGNLLREVRLYLNLPSKRTVADGVLTGRRVPLPLLMSDTRLQKWALAAEVFGAIAVVVTLGFLVFEMRDHQCDTGTDLSSADGRVERLSEIYR